MIMEKEKIKCIKDFAESVQPLSYDEQGKLFGGFKSIDLNGDPPDKEKNNTICSGNTNCVGNGTCSNNENCRNNTICIQPAGGGDGDGGGDKPITPDF